VSPGLKVGLMFVACVWTAATVLTAIWAAWSFSVGNFSTVAPLHFLRATARLTATALFVPFASLLISAYKCGGGKKWSSSEWDCYGPEHVTIMSVVSILLPFFWAFTTCVAAVFFDKDYISPNITARAHGRVAFVMITIKMVLTLVFTVAGEGDAWVLHVLVVAAGVAWMYLFLRYLPFYRQVRAGKRGLWPCFAAPTHLPPPPPPPPPPRPPLPQVMNQAWTAMGSVYTWAGICAIVARLLDDPKAAVAGYAFYLGVPVAAYGGYALAFMRYERLGAAIAADAAESVATASGLSRFAPATPYDVEMRARFLLRNVLVAAQAGGRSGKSHAVPSHVGASKRQVQPHGGEASRRGSAMSHGSHGGSGAGDGGHAYALAPHSATRRGSAASRASHGARGSGVEAGTHATGGGWGAFQDAMRHNPAAQAGYLPVAAHSRTDRADSGVDGGDGGVERRTSSRGRAASRSRSPAAVRGPSSGRASVHGPTDGATDDHSHTAPRSRADRRGSAASAGPRGRRDSAASRPLSAEPALDRGGDAHGWHEERRGHASAGDAESRRLLDSEEPPADGLGEEEVAEVSDRWGGVAAVLTTRWPLWTHGVGTGHLQGGGHVRHGGVVHLCVIGAAAPLLRKLHPGEAACSAHSPHLLLLIVAARRPRIHRRPCSASSATVMRRWRFW